MKKLIERKLLFSKKYSVLNISITGMDTDWSGCDNCGRPIANKATAGTVVKSKFWVSIFSISLAYM